MASIKTRMRTKKSTFQDKKMLERSKQHKAARFFARNGISVVGLVASTKIPYRGTNGLHDATTDLTVIDEHWTERPNSNVGLACGKRFWVLDIDVKNGVDGEQALRELESKHGPLPDTLTQITPSGGRHLFFKSDPDRPVTNSNALPRGLDVRGFGGYVLADPSEIDGKKYRWVGGRPDFDAIAEAPDWLYDYLRPASETGTHVARPASEWAKLTDYAYEGERHERIKSIAGLLVNALRHQREAAANLVYAFNESRCIPPLSDEEVYSILEWTGEQQARKGGYYAE